MHFSTAIFLFDIAAVAMMAVIAYLSKRMGDALKIPPFYRIIYIAAALILAMSLIDAGNISLLQIYAPPYCTMAIRLIAAVTAAAVALRYWNWIITEFFKR